jgi:opacity protein-like surface antigen
MKTSFIVVLISFLISSVQAAELVEGKGRFGLGLASITTGVGNSTVLTGWIPLKQSMGFQPYLGIPSTAGSFSFITGTAFKVTVAGNSQAAFHLGGNVLLGSTSNLFYLGLGGLIGVHYAPAQSVLLSVDGGPQLSLLDGNANFSMGALSSVLGASLIFLF